MEVIQLAGYTEEEKLEIAKRYLVPRQIERNGLRKSWISFSDRALRTIISDYTREAGVRNLEREIGNVLRNVAVRIAEGSAQQVKIGPDDLAAILGPRKFDADFAMSDACRELRPDSRGRRWAGISCSSKPPHAALASSS